MGSEGVSCGSRGPLVGRSHSGPSASLDIPTRCVPGPRWRFGADSSGVLPRLVDSGSGVTPKYANEDRENDLGCVWRWSQGKEDEEEEEEEEERLLPANQQKD